MCFFKGAKTSEAVFKHTFIKSPAFTLAAERTLIRTWVSISHSDKLADCGFWGSGGAAPRALRLNPLTSSSSTWSEERSTRESIGLTPLDTQVRMYWNKTRNKHITDDQTSTELIVSFQDGSRSFYLQMIRPKVNRLLVGHKLVHPDWKSKESCVISHYSSFINPLTTEMHDCESIANILGKRTFSLSKLPSGELSSGWNDFNSLGRPTIYNVIWQDCYTPVLSVSYMYTGWFLWVIQSFIKRVSSRNAPDI